MLRNVLIGWRKVHTYEVKSLYDGKGNSADNEPSPASTSHGFWTKFALGITAVLAVVALVLGAYATASAISSNDLDNVSALQDYHDNQDAIITSLSQASVPAGYVYGGSLFQGSGYWTNTKDMLHQRSEHAVRFQLDVIPINENPIHVCL
jgi:hypothetical protein